MHKESFLHNLKSHWKNFIKPCIHIHINRTNTCSKKVRARGQFYESYFPLWFLMAFVYVKTVPWWADQLLSQLLMEQCDTLYTQCRHIEHMHEGVCFTKNYYWRNDSYENLDNFSDCITKGLCLFYHMAFVYVKTVPWWADQLLSQLLMEQFDTLYTQCRHIEHMHEGVCFTKNYYWRNDSYENLDNFSGRSTSITAFDGAMWYFVYTM